MAKYNPFRFVGGNGPLRILSLPLFNQRIPVAKQRTGLRDALAKRGKVYEMDRRFYLSKPGRPKHWLASIVKEVQPDLMLLQWHGSAEITPEMIKRARAVKPDMMVVNFCGDAQHGKMISRRVLALLKTIDLQTTKQAAVFPVYEEHRIPYAYWQQCYEPYQGRLPKVPEYDVVCLMNIHGRKRERFARAVEGLRRLKVDGRPIKVGLFGSGWRGADGHNQYDYAAGEALYRRAKLAIGDTYPWTLGYCSNRPIQCMAAGGAMLLLEHSRHLDFFTGLEACVHYDEWYNVNELPGMVERWLSPSCEEERRRLVTNARAHVMRNFTGDALVSGLLDGILPQVRNRQNGEFTFRQRRSEKDQQGADGRTHELQLVPT